MAKSLEERLKVMAEKQRRAAENSSSPLRVPDEPAAEDMLVDCGKEPEALTVSRLSPVLPVVGDDNRVMANAILRSSLFGVVKTGKGLYEKKELKATIKGLTLRVTGPQLNQSDLDVFLECLHRHQKLPLGSVIQFTAGSFLKAIGRNVGNKDYIWLDDVLSRLAVYGLELGDGQRFYQGTLLHEMYRDQKTREYAIVVNQKFSVFFANGFWTELSVNERSALKGKQLALWLHGSYSTQSAPYAYKVETLKSQCGSVAALKEFRRMLGKALSDISAVTGWDCWIDEKTDLVHVKKTKAVSHE